MKRIKDKIVMDDAYYLVHDYLYNVDFAPLKSRGICKYDNLTGRPIFKMEMIDYSTFIELFQEGMEWMLSKSLPFSIDNIDKLT